MKARWYLKIYRFRLPARDSLFLYFVIKYRYQVIAPFAIDIFPPSGVALKLKESQRNRVKRRNKSVDDNAGGSSRIRRERLAAAFVRAQPRSSLEGLEGHLCDEKMYSGSSYSAVFLKDFLALPDGENNSA